jgi:hypothetical protein
MKKNLLKVLLGLILGLGACALPSLDDQKKSFASDQQSNGNTASDVVANPFSKKVGAPIDTEKADRWILNYKKLYGISKSYNIESAKITTVLSQPGCIGISLHYSTDENKNLHILPIGVNDSGKIITSDKVAIENGYVDWRTAQQWIANYSGPATSHFFGTNTFNRLISEQKTVVINVTLALNDGLDPVLILANAASTSSDFKEDDSITCPPFCPAN